jgi:hypothetical protein
MIPSPSEIEKELERRGRAVSARTKKEILIRIFNAWLSVPEQRLGQLLLNACPDLLFQIEDDKLAEAVEAFITPPEKL